MVRAWYMNYDATVDQREAHQFVPSQMVQLDYLEKLGVKYYKIEGEKDPVLEEIRTNHKYTFEDMITCSKDKLENYDEKLKIFFTEHLHADDESRYVTKGSGYFDVRDPDDKWIRVEVVEGDLIILPAGIYHRFTLDDKNFIQARRYFAGNPVWTPHNRPNDDHKARKDYLASLAVV